MMNLIKLLLKGGIFKKLWTEGVKKNIIKPVLLWMGVVGGSKSIYDYAQWELIQKGVVLAPENGKPFTVLVMTPLMNLYQWIMNGNLMLFISACINNISYYLKLPFVMITYSLMFFIIIIVILIIYYIVYKYIIYLDTPIINEKQQIVKSPVFEIIEEKIVEVISKQNKEIVVNLETKNKLLLVSNEELNKQVVKLEKEISNLKQEKIKLEISEKKLQQSEKQFKIKENTLKKQLQANKKLITNLQNKVKNKKQGIYRYNRKSPESKGKIKKKLYKNSKNVNKKVVKKSDKSKAAKKGWITRRKSKLNFIN